MGKVGPLQGLNMSHPREEKLCEFILVAGKIHSAPQKSKIGVIQRQLRGRIEKTVPHARVTVDQLTACLVLWHHFQQDLKGP